MKRYGVALLATSLLVYVFVSATLPALEERSRVRRQREAAELEVDAMQREAEARLLWTRGAREDEFLRARLEDVRDRSPGLVGPRYLEVVDEETDDESPEPPEDT